MQIQINPAEGIQTSEALEQHIHRRLDTIGKRFGDRLTRIEVYLKDVNGPKGGVDKHCTLEARPRGLGPSIAESTADEAYVAVHGAASRLEKVLETRFGRLSARARAGPDNG